MGSLSLRLRRCPGRRSACEGIDLMRTARSGDASAAGTVSRMHLQDRDRSESRRFERSDRTALVQRPHLARARRPAAYRRSRHRRGGARPSRARKRRCGSRARIAVGRRSSRYNACRLQHCRAVSGGAIEESAIAQILVASSSRRPIDRLHCEREEILLRHLDRGRLSETKLANIDGHGRWLEWKERT